jgi:hypothetical protein
MLLLSLVDSFVLIISFVLALGIVLVVGTNLSLPLLSHVQMYLSYASVGWRTAKAEIANLGRP